MKKEAFSFVFSKGGKLPSKYLEMVYMSATSFFVCNGYPITIFLVNVDPEDVIALTKKVKNATFKIVDPGFLPEGWEISTTIGHAIRFSHVIRDSFEEGSEIGYFDIDMVHVREWEFPKDLKEGQIGVCIDLGLSVIPYLNKRLNTLLDKFFGEKDRQTIYNTGVLMWRAGKGENEFLEEVWQRCLNISSEGYQAKDNLYQDQDIFNGLVYNYIERVYPLPGVHNQQSIFHRGHEKSPGTYWAAIGDWQRSLGAHRYHAFSCLRGLQVPTLRMVWEEYISHRLPAEDINYDDFAVVVVNKDQGKHIHRMLSHILKSLPGIKVTYVLDRCSDNSEEILTLEYPQVTVVKADDSFQGYRVASNRNLGSVANRGKHILFLDGDRVPQGLSWEILQKAIATMSMCCMRLPLHSEIRVGGFVGGFSYNQDVWPLSISDTGYSKVFSNGILIRKDAIKDIEDVTQGELFLECFNGSYGEEDVTIGNIAGILGHIVGFFPLHVYTEGGLTTMAKGTWPYRNKEISRRIHNSLRASRFSSFFEERDKNEIANILKEAIGSCLDSLKAHDPSAPETSNPSRKVHTRPLRSKDDILKSLKSRI